MGGGLSNVCILQLLLLTSKKKWFGPQLFWTCEVATPLLMFLFCFISHSTPINLYIFISDIIIQVWAVNRSTIYSFHFIYLFTKHHIKSTIEEFR